MDRNSFGVAWNKVLSLEDPLLNTFHVDTYTDAFTELVNEHRPEILLIGATRNGLEFAPRTGRTTEDRMRDRSNEIRTYAERKYLLMDRIAVGGQRRRDANLAIKTSDRNDPERHIPPLPADSSRNGEIIKAQPKIKPPSTKVLETKPKATKGVKLSEAQVIVSFGRGVRKKEDMAMIESFAEAVGGTIGCSRPIAEDLGWLPEEQYIGLSGQKVSPKLYFACGISGQIQHLTGIRNSRTIVAINNDSKAPIFEFSDYGLVADLYEAIPALTEAIKGLRKKMV